MCSAGSKPEKTEAMKKAFENVSKFCNPKQFENFGPFNFMKMMMGGCPMKKSSTKKTCKKSKKSKGCPWMKRMASCGMNKTQKPAAFMTFEEQLAQAKNASLNETSASSTKTSQEPIFKPTGPP